MLFGVIGSAIAAKIAGVDPSAMLKQSLEQAGYLALGLLFIVAGLVFVVSGTSAGKTATAVAEAVGRVAPLA